MNAMKVIPQGWIVPEHVQHTRRVRGLALADIQLACTAGPYELDILVREQLSAPTLQLIGQVTMASKSSPVADIPVVLVRADTPETIADARTDDFGEFDMATERKTAYGLRIGLGEGAPLVLVWDGVHTE